MLDLTISRRSVLGAAAAFAGSAAIKGPDAAFAEATPVGTQAPFFYRFKLGKLEATVVSDGQLGPIGEPTNLFPKAPKEDLEELIKALYVTRKVVLDENVLVLNTGDQLVLFDTGLGTEKGFGPNSGRLLDSLKAASIDPSSIDAVIVTHAHPDHCWGLVGGDGKPNFPKAKICMHQADYDFWTDEGKLSNDKIKDWVAGTRKVLVPLRERITFIKDGADVVPGVQAMLTPGHTVGHTSYVVTEGDESLVILGDVAHHSALSLARPHYVFGFDTDGEQGVATRKKAFDMLAANRTTFLAYHFPWPGIGNVSKDGEGYRYHPMPMRVVPE
jgi:glyoxylase-like metal-dependent hydrolase (beta-lactamase superfamily II)